MKHSIFLPLFIIFLVNFGFSDSSFAYIDPGAGSMFLQLLLGGIAGAIVVLKLYWHKFTGFFRRNGSQESDRFPPEDQK